MKRLLVLGCAAVALLLALHRPAPSPAIASANAAPLSQHSHKGHPSSRLAGASAVVYVVGAVARPGLYRVGAGARVDDALRQAGGLRSDADPAAVNLAEHVTDGEEIHVPRDGETPPKPSRRRTRKTSTRKAVSSAAEPPVDLNTADAAALSSLPGIGPTLAERIVAFRRLNGPFASLDELADVAGMTQRRIDALAAYATVGGSP